MSEYAQDPVKLHVRYLDVKKRTWFFVNPIDKLDELKAKLVDFFYPYWFKSKNTWCNNKCANHWLMGG